MILDSPSRRSCPHDERISTSMNMVPDLTTPGDGQNDYGDGTTAPESRSQSAHETMGLGAASIRSRHHRIPSLTYANEGEPYHKHAHSHRIDEHTIDRPLEVHSQTARQTCGHDEPSSRPQHHETSTLRGADRYKFRHRQPASDTESDDSPDVAEGKKVHEAAQILMIMRSGGRQSSRFRRRASSTLSKRSSSSARKQAFSTVRGSRASYSPAEAPCRVDNQASQARTHQPFESTASLHPWRPAESFLRTPLHAEDASKSLVGLSTGSAQHDARPSFQETRVHVKSRSIRSAPHAPVAFGSHQQAAPTVVLSRSLSSQALLAAHSLPTACRDPVQHHEQRSTTKAGDTRCDTAPRARHVSVYNPSDGTYEQRQAYLQPYALTSSGMQQPTNFADGHAMHLPWSSSPVPNTLGLNIIYPHRGQTPSAASRLGRETNMDRLQHAAMGATGAQVTDPEPHPEDIDPHLLAAQASYDQVGGITEAIRDEAAEAFEIMSPAEQQQLVDLLGTYQEARHPPLLYDLLANSCQIDWHHMADYVVFVALRFYHSVGFGRND